MRGYLLYITGLCALLVVLEPLPLWGGTFPEYSPGDVVRLSTSGGALRGGGDNGSSGGGLYGLISYDDVAVIYNVNSHISRAIMENFTSRRGIPRERVIGVDVPAVESIGRETFEDLRAQVEEALRERDLTGRVNYLVTVKGVPLRVWGPGSAGSASVDSELALILGPYAGYIGGAYWVNNPYYGKSERFSRDKYGFYIVTRLTGYNLSDALSLIYRAERSGGARGVFLLDVDPGKGGGYAAGNRWLRNANRTLTEMGYETFLDETRTFITDFQNCSGYASWGSNDGHYSTVLNSNPGFESGIDPWTVEGDGEVSLNTTSPYRGERCLEVRKNSTAPLLLRGNVMVKGSRAYYISGHVNMSGGEVHFSAVTLSSSGRVLRRDEGSPLKGPTGTWKLMRQLALKPLPSEAAYLRIEINISGAGEFFFDEIRLLEVKPHNGWVPGAIAETYVSSSGRTFTWPPYYGQSLIADLIRDGVSGAKGYVYEPYLSAMAEPDILFPRYVSGYTMGESYYMASPYLSWRGVVVGDPKMTPYGRKAEITSAAALQSVVNPGQQVNIGVRVENTGYGDICGLPLLLRFKDGVLSDMERVVNITRGEDSLIWFNFTAPSPGTYLCEVILNSGGVIPFMNLNGTRAEVLFRVNHPPGVTFMKSSSDYVRRGGSVTLTAGILDADDRPENLTWEGWVTGPGGVNSTLIMELHNSNLTSSFTPPLNWSTGFASFHLLLRDPHGASTLSVLNDAFFILNNPPEIESIEWSKEVVRGSEFVLNLTLQDPDTPPAALQVSGYLQGYGRRIELHVEGDGELFTLSGTIPLDAVAGEYDIRLTVDDGINVTGFYRPEAVRVLNSPPRIYLLTPPPEGLLRGCEARFEVGGEDLEDTGAHLDLLAEADEGLELHTVRMLPGQWEVIAEALPHANLGPHTVHLQVVDSDGDLSGILNVTLHIQNSPPEVKIKSLRLISPNLPGDMLSTLDVTLEVRDGDGSGRVGVVLNFSGAGQRVVDLGSVRGEFHHTMRVWGNFTPGVWMLRAEATDGDGGVAFTSWVNFTVRDLPPVIVSARAVGGENGTHLTIRVVDEDLPPGCSLTLTVLSEDEVVFRGRVGVGECTLVLPPLNAFDVNVTDGYLCSSVHVEVARGNGTGPVGGGEGGGKRGLPLWIALVPVGGAAAASAALYLLRRRRSG